MARMSLSRRREAINGYLFILPWLIGFITFVAGPMLFSLYASFNDYDVTSKMRWVGLDNYRRLITDDSLFWTSLYNTGFYVLFAVPLGIITGLLIAVLLNQQVPGQRIFRTIFFLPKVLTGVAVLLLWLWVFNPDFGPINVFLRAIGIQNPPLWFSDPTWAKPALIIMSAWGAAGGYIIYLAGLQGIPRHLYEASMLDGASPFRQFLSITVPMMSPTIFFKVITGISGAFQFWEAALIVSDGGKGGPSYSTLFYGLYMWQKAFNDYQMGYASAMAWVLLLIILAITGIQFFVSRRWVHYEGDVR
ncbi:ABC transporter permease [Deinococcus irradiatisoli]|uniref:ABC transporter permease n=1 Tax=Deinococcus irradiatisoli TaxID=2202254 RepID=A0A2Z3JEQ0_9DEIO|nr:sugar ABC transporter permease [Deinococcus irradiatisoli]AWN21951.1 ABC transporter permease [Deinococcus irradiatisoli]